MASPDFHTMSAQELREYRRGKDGSSAPLRLSEEPSYPRRYSPPGEGFWARSPTGRLSPRTHRDDEPSDPSLRMSSANVSAADAQRQLMFADDPDDLDQEVAQWAEEGVPSVTGLDYAKAREQVEVALSSSLARLTVDESQSAWIDGLDRAAWVSETFDQALSVSLEHFARRASPGGEALTAEEEYREVARSVTQVLGRELDNQRAARADLESLTLLERRVEDTAREWISRHAARMAVLNAERTMAAEAARAGAAELMSLEAQLSVQYEQIAFLEAAHDQTPATKKISGTQKKKKKKKVKQRSSETETETAEAASPGGQLQVLLKYQPQDERYTCDGVDCLFTGALVVVTEHQRTCPKVIDPSCGGDDRVRRRTGHLTRLRKEHDDMVLQMADRTIQMAELVEVNDALEHQIVEKTELAATDALLSQMKHAQEVRELAERHQAERQRHAQEVSDLKQEHRAAQVAAARKHAEELHAAHDKHEEERMKEAYRRERERAEEAESHQASINQLEAKMIKEAEAHRASVNLIEEKWTNETAQTARLRRQRAREAEAHQASVKQIQAERTKETASLQGQVDELHEMLDVDLQKMREWQSAEELAEFQRQEVWSEVEKRQGKAGPGDNSPVEKCLEQQLRERQQFHDQQAGVLQEEFAERQARLMQQQMSSGAEEVSGAYLPGRRSSPGSPGHGRREVRLQAQVRLLEPPEDEE